MRKVAFICSLVFIFVIPMEKVIFIPGLGSLARIVGILTMLLWVISVVFSGRVKKPTLFHFVVLLFVLWNASSVFWSLDIESSVDRIQTWFQLAALVALIWDLYTTPEALNAALQAYVLGAYVSVGGTIQNYLSANAFVYGRYSAGGLHVVDLGLVVALGIPLAWYLAIPKKPEPHWSKWFRVINVMYLPVALLGIALTGSRGAMISAFPAVFFILASLRELRRLPRVFFFLISTTGLLYAQTLVPQSSLERLGSAYTELTEGGDLSGRVGLWREGLILFSEHPILGIGSNAYKTTVELGQIAHNTFLSILVELGIIGLILFIIALLLNALGPLRQKNLESRLWLTVLACWAIGASTLTWEHQKTTWLILSLVAVSSSLRPELTEQRVGQQFRPILHGLK